MFTFVLDPDSPWCHKNYIRGELLELSPTLIRNMFDLLDTNIIASLTHLLKTKPEHIAQFITARKGNSFGHSEVALLNSL